MKIWLISSEIPSIIDIDSVAILFVICFISIFENQKSERNHEPVASPVDTFTDKNCWK